MESISQERSLIVDSWQIFARITITTNDLDPMYSVIRSIHDQEWDPQWKGRFLLYFLCFYHAGDAAACADKCMDKPDQYYWEYMVSAAVDPATKRAAERRHFRGAAAVRALAKLQSYQMSPEELIFSFWGSTYSKLYQRMTTEFAGTQMGPYFIWKIYDIQTVCLERPITLSLDEAMKYMPEEPRRAAKYFFPDMEFRDVLKMMNQFVERLPHPVRNGYCGLAEVETILCMMKGFFQTRVHTIGDDIDDKFHQMEGHTDLQILLPPRVKQGVFIPGHWVHTYG
jgi:hypothetical protein